LRALVQGHGHTQAVQSIRAGQENIHHNMLHFLENHDEQRIASAAFAGDPWKAMPAMVISATVDDGAVMIYFGQEVGEPGHGAEGFQTEDGRTTIFDYWGVPEHQKWMNNGNFSGDSLSQEQKQLRQSYSDLLNLASKNEALRQGEYLDLTAHNIGQGNFTDKVCAYIRYAGDERLIVVASFNNAEQTCKVNIPKEFFTRMGLDPEGTYIARDLLWREAEVGFDKNQTFELKLKPYSSYIFKIK
jgi:glycosidase